MLPDAFALASLNHPNIAQIYAVANYRGIDLSPDGTRVAAHRHDGEGGDIWITNVTTNATSRFTFNAD